MNKIFRKILIIVLALSATVAAAAALSACSVGPPSPNDEIKSKNLVGHVTYYANGGKFNNNDEVVLFDLYYRADTPIINVGLDDVTDIKIAQTGKVLVGWYYAQLDPETGTPLLVDAEGNPVTEAYDEEGNLLLDSNNKAKYVNENGDIYLHNQVYPVSSGNALSFSDFRIGKGEHIYLCAEWVEDISIKFVLVSDSDITDSSGNTYSTGDVIGSDYFGTASRMNLRASAPLNAADATFIKFYNDEACTDELEVNTPIDKPEEGNVVVYAKYITGSWTKVSSASQVSAMFNGLGSSSNKYFIMNDIDCSNLSVIGMRNGAFNCTIEGDGHVISNLNFTGTIKAGQALSALGSLSDKAVIKNLTLENVTVTASISVSGVNVYAICNGYDEGATLENFTFNGLTLVISKPQSSVIYNIPELPEGGYQTGHYLFDDGTNASTDAAFLAIFTGVTVNNGTIQDNENQ